MRRPLFFCFAPPVFAFALTAQAQNQYFYEKAPIKYLDTDPVDAVTKLDDRIRAGQVKVDGSARDQLRVLLRELRIPEASQVLVFSKTSLQEDRINPRNPRAIYFGDDAYVGWSQGGSFEVVGIDGSLGPVFYLYDPNANPQPEYRFQRDIDCLRCHGTFYTDRVPGLFVRSVYVSDAGFPLSQTGSTTVDHTVPFEDRWAGWYVTGRHGKARHLGNTFFAKDNGGLVIDREKGANIEDLSRFCDTSRYLAPGSDIVALMLLEHQCAVQTALTSADYSVREALYRQGRESGDPMPSEPEGDSIRWFDEAAEKAMNALFLRKEAPLPEGGIQGNPAFQAAFAQHAVKTKAGQSLKDLDLGTRLLRRRCSYLIYGTSFQNLCPPFKKRLVASIRQVLEGRDPANRYAYIPAEERAEILQILRETHPDFKQS